MNCENLGMGARLGWGHQRKDSFICSPISSSSCWSWHLTRWMRMSKPCLQGGMKNWFDRKHQCCLLFLLSWRGCHHIKRYCCCSYNSNRIPTYFLQRREVTTPWEFLICNHDHQVMTVAYCWVLLIVAAMIAVIVRLCNSLSVWRYWQL